MRTLARRLHVLGKGWLALSVSDEEREGASCARFICRGKAGPTARATLTERPVWFGGKPVVRDGWKVPTLEDTRGPRVFLRFWQLPISLDGLSL